MTFFSRAPVFVFPRRLMPRTDKMRISISSATPPAASRQKSLPCFREIVNLLAGIGVEDNSSNRNREYRIAARFPVAIRAFTVAPAIGAKFTIVTVAQQCVVVRVRFQPDITAIASVAARWPAAWDILLPAEREAAIAAVAALHQDFGFINEHRALN